MIQCMFAIWYLVPLPFLNQLEYLEVPCRATQDGRVMVESSDKTWLTRGGNGKPFQYSCLENPMNSESEVVQLCLTLCNPMNCSLPGSSIHRIFQARILECIAISFSKKSSWPRGWTWVSHIVGKCFTVWATREVHKRVELSSIWLSDKLSARQPGRPTHVNHILEIPCFGFPVGITQPEAGAFLLAQSK